MPLQSGEVFGVETTDEVFAGDRERAGCAAPAVSERGDPSSQEIQYNPLRLITAGQADAGRDLADTLVSQAHPV
jgi:hypothetical protein